MLRKENGIFKKEKRTVRKAKTAEERRRRRREGRKMVAAAERGDIGGIRAALAAGGTNSRGSFLAAVRSGQDLAAVYSLERGAKADDPSLMAAALASDRPEVVKALVDKGADPDRERLLECAAELGREELAAWLLERGADAGRARLPHRRTLRAWFGTEKVPALPGREKRADSWTRERLLQELESDPLLGALERLRLRYRC